MVSATRSAVASALAPVDIEIATPVAGWPL